MISIKKPFWTTAAVILLVQAGLVGSDALSNLAFADQSIALKKTSVPALIEELIYLLEAGRCSLNTTSISRNDEAREAG